MCSFLDESPSVAGGFSPGKSLVPGVRKQRMLYFYKTSIKMLEVTMASVVFVGKLDDMGCALRHLFGATLPKAVAFEASLADAADGVREWRWDYLVVRASDLLLGAPPPGLEIKRTVWDGCPNEVVQIQVIGKPKTRNDRRRYGRVAGEPFPGPVY